MNKNKGGTVVGVESEGLSHVSRSTTHLIHGRILPAVLHPLGSLLQEKHGPIRAGLEGATKTIKERE